MRAEKEPSPVQTLLGPPPAPTPAGEPLALEVPCAASRAWPADPPRHRVTLLSDWTVDTAHDLDAERLVVALGGWSSCLHLAETVVPAVREWLALNLRRRLPDVRRRGEQWVAAAEGCRARHTFDTAAHAAEHVRGLGHVGSAHDADPRLLDEVAAAVERAYGGRWAFAPDRVALQRARAAVLRPDDAVTLWDAGLPPHLVTHVHDQLSAHGRPLPVGLYLGVLSGRPDLRWLHDSSASLPADPAYDDDRGELLEWLAWTYTSVDATEPQARAELLDLGLLRRQVIALLAAGYRAGDVWRLALDTGRCEASAASLLAGWAALGCAPGADVLVRLERLGVPLDRAPSRGALEALRAGAQARGCELPLTALGLLLAVAGNARRALAWLAAGLTEPVLAADRLRYGDDPTRPPTTTTATAAAAARPTTSTGGVR